MRFIAHNGGFNTGEPEGFSHFARENSLKVLFISFVFIAVTYAITTLLLKHYAKASATSSHKKPTKELTDD